MSGCARGGVVDMLRPHLPFRPLALVLSIAPFLASVLTVTPASAGLDLCRTDPIVWLSNGTQIHLRAAISDNAADVQGVQYVLQLPPGVAVSRSVYTGSALRGKETVTSQTSTASGTVSVQTLVTTGASDVPVTVSAAVPGGDSGSQSGLAGQQVSLTLAL